MMLDNDTLIYREMSTRANTGDHKIARLAPPDSESTDVNTRRLQGQPTESSSPLTFDRCIHFPVWQSPPSFPVTLCHPQ